MSVFTGEKCNPHYCADAHLHHCGDVMSYSQRSVPLIDVEHLMYKDAFFLEKIQKFTVTVADGQSCIASKCVNILQVFLMYNPQRY